MKVKIIHQLVKVSLVTAIVSTSVQADANIEFAGVIETSVTNSSDIDKAQAKVDTVELAITATMNDKVSAEVVLLSEDLGTDDETQFAVDSALINMETKAGVLSAGKFTVPFTTGETNMIEDSTTLVEPVGVGISLSNSFKSMEYTLYVADPMSAEAADITGNTYADETALGFGDLAGLNVNVALTDTLSVNGSYVSLDGESSSSAALVASAGEFGVILEGTAVNGESETRTNLELSYGLGFATVAVSQQKNGAGDAISSLGVSADVYENTGLNIQYMLTDPKAAGDNTTAITAQLAYEF